MKKELLLRLKIMWNVIRCLFSFDFKTTYLISSQTGEIISEKDSDHNKVWKARMAQNEWVIDILVSAILHPNSERAKVAHRLIDDGIPVQYLREQERLEKGPWVGHDIVPGPEQNYCDRCGKDLRIYPKGTKCLTVEEYNRTLA